MELLEKKGHKNIIFSMHHPQNFNSDYSKYFISYINYTDELKNKNFLSGLKVLYRSIYSLEAKKNMEKLIKEEKPDIAHIESLHHYITHSILYPLKENKVPIVWTLHDYALICPNTLFLCRGQVCEKCKKNKFYWSILTRCKKDSLGASFVAMTETVVHRIMKIYDLVDVFITPSEFLRTKLIEYGLDKDKIVCLNNFIDANRDIQEGNNEDYFLYAGRISQEKNLISLIDAALKVDACKLKIVGDGPLKEEMISYVQSRNKTGIIEFLGHKGHKDVIQLLRNCKFMVIPSVYYENFPYSILEAFACGKPVIGARIGGIPELIKDNVTGLIFEPGNIDDLSAKIKYLIDNPEKGIEWGRNAQLFVEQELNSEKHYHKLMEIYNSVLSGTKISSIN